MVTYFDDGRPNSLTVMRLVPFQIIGNGDMGVDAFFVLSGFLIAHLGMRELARSGSLALCRFYKRRWLRITPAYIAAIVLTRFLQFETDPNGAAGAVRASEQLQDNCKDWWYLNVLFINNFQNYIDADSDYCLAQSWSISTEFQFYLLTPPLVLLLSAPDKAVCSVGAARKYGLLLMVGMALFTLVFRGVLEARYDGKGEFQNIVMLLV